MKKVLFFPAWFPNKNSNLSGSFVLEHAKCLNNKFELGIFHILDDFELKTWFKFEIEIIEDVRLFRMSFRRLKSNIFYPINAILYFLATIKGYLYVKKTFGKADLNHVHVLTRTAILPFFLKIIYSTPYVISEHWSRYLPERNSYHGFIRKQLTKFIVKNSSGLCTVSKDLMMAMKNHQLNHSNSLIVSNTVSNEWFMPFEYKKNEVYNFLHVSGIQDSIKNITGILRTAEKLKAEGLNFKLEIVGDDIERKEIEFFSNKLGLKSMVTFHGKLFGKDLVEKYRATDTFVLFSNFENQPCVLLESFACGLPVIATNVGGISEIVNTRNGVLVNAKDENELLYAMKNFILGSYNFDREAIKKEASLKYSYDSVANQLLNFYKLSGLTIK